MTRRAKRSASEMPLVRVKGRRWSVAMCDTDWDKFLNLDPIVYARFIAVFDCFCRQGDANLPSRIFGWLAPVESAPGARPGKFEARGVMVSGHAAPSDQRNIFFVTAITVDPPGEISRSRRKSPADMRQGTLPFTSSSRKGQDHD